MSGQDAPVFESPLLATPLTAGLLAAKILVPSAWRQWPEDTRRAVLAHELAHVERRDALISLLARLKCCFFWFHPLAWWLERKLALTAEQAADDAGVRAVGESRRYAEVLLDMAEAVRRHGTRLSWQGVGVGGAGLLAQRIDRIVRGDLPRRASRTRKACIASTCVAAILFPAACRRQAEFGRPQDDPRVAVEFASRQPGNDFERAARAMSADEGAQLEAIVKKNPDALVFRKKLLLFYRGSLPDEKSIAAWRRHILWVIQHQPESELAAWGSLVSDPEGYREARKAWLRQVERADTPVAVLSNAASFFSRFDKPLAEQALIRLRSADPKGRWSGELGHLYAAAVLGMGPVVSVEANAADAQGPYAQEARRKLAASNDPTLLSAAGNVLTGVGRYLHDQGRIDFDPVPLGKTCLDRALKLDPGSKVARTGLSALERQRPRR